MKSMTWCCLIAPMIPNTETKSRNTPLAVMPPMMGRLVIMPENLPGDRGNGVEENYFDME